jgi:hypothetical protein
MKNTSSLYAENENEASRKADNHNQSPLNVPLQQLARPSGGKRKAAEDHPNHEGPMSMDWNTADVSSQKEGIEELTIEQQEDILIRGEDEMRALEQPPDRTLSWTSKEWIKATEFLVKQLDDIDDAKHFEKKFGVPRIGGPSTFQLTKAIYDYFKSNATTMRALKERDSYGFLRVNMEGLEYPSLYKLIHCEYDSMQENDLSDYMDYLYESLDHLRRVDKHLALLETDLLTLSNQSHQAEVATITCPPSHVASAQKEMQENGMTATLSSHKPQQMTTHRDPVLQDIALDDFKNEFDRNILKGFSQNFQDYLGCIPAFQEKSLKKVNTIEAAKETLALFLETQDAKGTLLTKSCFDNKKALFPHPNDDEENIVQPIMKVFLNSLGNVINKAVDNSSEDEREQSYSPAKSKALSGRITPGGKQGDTTDIRKVRKMDKSLTNDLRRFLIIMRDDNIEFPIEEKTGCKKNKAKKLLCAAANQIYAHLAKHLTIGFNFMGSGIDTKATGIILTPYCVQIIQLCLEGMGTLKAKIVIYETGLLPLMSKKNYESWSKGVKKGNLPDVNELYGDSYSENDIPSGNVAIYKVMRLKRKHFFGHEGFEADDLSEQLGFGSFALTYLNKRDANQVVKISRYGIKDDLVKEASILSQLKTSSEGVVQLLREDNIMIKIGEVDVGQKALFLSPVGIPIEEYLSSLNSNVKTDALLACMHQLYSALVFIHSKYIRHNDVSPTNCLIDVSSKNDPKAFLIDFGIATKGWENTKGYIGTPQFSAESVFLKHPRKKWDQSSPEGNADLSALALSIAWLMKSGGDRPWKSIQPDGKCVQDWAYKRVEIAVGLTKHEVPHDTVWFWDALLNSVEEDSRKTLRSPTFDFHTNHARYARTQKRNKKK